MDFRELKMMAISACFLALGAACSSGDNDGLDLNTPWLGPLYGFERVSGKDDTGVFLKKTTGATDRFERGLIAPPEIVVSAGSDLESISPAIYDNIKALFTEVFRQEMAKQIPIAETGAEREAASHLIQAALINITVTRKTDSPFAVQLGDLQFSFESAKIEAEIRVRKSNARRAAFILPLMAEKTSWNALRPVFTAFARLAATEAGKTRSAIDAKAEQPPPPAVKTPAEK